MATRPTPVRVPPRATMPAEPAAFVAAAEKITNDRDAAAVAAVFALDAYPRTALTLLREQRRAGVRSL